MELQGYLLIDSNKLSDIAKLSYLETKEKYIAKKATLTTDIEVLQSNLKEYDNIIKTTTTQISSLEKAQATNVVLKEGYYCFETLQDGKAFENIVNDPTNLTNSDGTLKDLSVLYRYKDYSITWRSTLDNTTGLGKWVYCKGVTVSIKSGELVENMTNIVLAKEQKSKFTTRKLIVQSEVTYQQKQLENIDKVIQTATITLKLDKHKLFVEGKKITDEEYLIGLTGRCLVKDIVPTVDEDIDTPSEYDRYVLINRAVKMKLNSNLDILEHDEFSLVAYEIDELITIPANSFAGASIVNILEMNDYKYENIKTVLDTGLEEIKKVQLPDLDWEGMFKRQGGNYADVYLKPDFSKITDGKIEVETSTQSTGIQESKQVWKGNYPLDRLIYTIQSNLDILMANRKINGDAYGNLYATLLAQAIQSATVLEQARLQAYEQASQFQIKSMIEYYLGAITAKLNVVKTLAEVSTAFLQKSVLQAQIKLYNIQTNGFKANNTNKVFTTQFEGASTAFSSGMLDSPPAILNNSDLMHLYTNVSSDMNVL